MVADYLKRKIQEGWARVVREHPGIDFGMSTPEVNAAWAHLDAAYLNWAAGRNQVADVFRAFKQWEAALVAANQKTPDMFANENVI